MRVSFLVTFVDEIGHCGSAHNQHNNLQVAGVFLHGAVQLFIGDNACQIIADGGQDGVPQAGSQRGVDVSGGAA